MKIKLDDSWKKHLNHHINSEGFKNLVSFVKSEYQNHICYPKGGLIFSSLILLLKIKIDLKNIMTTLELSCYFKKRGGNTFMGHLSFRQQLTLLMKWYQNF